RPRRAACPWLSIAPSAIATDRSAGVTSRMSAKHRHCSSSSRAAPRSARRWIDVDLDHKVIMIGQQRIAYGHSVEDVDPELVAIPTLAPKTTPINAGSWSTRLFITHAWPTA